MAPDDPHMGRGDQSERLRSLAGLAHAVARSGPLTRLLEDAAEASRAALHAASVSVSRVEDGGDSVRTLLNVGELGPTEQRWPESEVYAISEFAHFRRVAGEGLAWTIAHDDPDADPDEVALLRALGKGSAVCAPLIVDGVLWGEFYATRHIGDAPYGADDTAYLEALSAIIAGAVSRAQREESLLELAYHDVLTGLLNRRALQERAAACFEAGPGDQWPVTVVVADVNGLKQVNDTHGHVAGDRLLTSVAATLVERFSGFPGALIARVGGDEFTVVVPGQPVESVLGAADQLCTASWDAGVSADVSCGAATAMVSGPGEPGLAVLFEAADRAQYVAKRGRLRRTVLDDAGAPTCETMGA